MPKEEIVARFSCCPVCGSERGFAQMLADEAKEKGYMSEDCEFYAQVITNIVIDPKMQRIMPVGGGFITAMSVCQETCLDCGNVYAKKLVRGVAQVRMQKVPTGPLGPPRISMS